MRGKSLAGTVKDVVLVLLVPQSISNIVCVCVRVRLWGGRVQGVGCRV